MQNMYADLVFSAELYQNFTYKIPADLSDAELVGRRIIAPFGSRRQVGYCVAVYEKFPGTLPRGLKNIVSIVDETPLFTERQLQFYRWLSDYYFAPPGMTLKAAHPSESGVKREPHLFTREGHETDERILSLGSFPLAEAELPALTMEQQSLIRQLIKENCLYRDNIFPRRMNDQTIRCLRLADLKRHGANEKQNLVIRWLKEQSNFEDTVKSIQSNTGVSASPLDSLLKAGIVEAFTRRVSRDPFDGAYEAKVRDVTLSAEQSAVIDAILAHAHEFYPALIRGVTGSGKTEVYIALAQAVLTAGRDVMILVPEISITPHVAGRFRSVFGKTVAIWHSQMTNAERFWTWNAIRRGEIKVVVGARSALFSPLNDPGLIIVDEEHDGSYKQDDPQPRYHGRDAALYFARLCNIPMVMGSATPALESYYNAVIGRYHSFELNQRFGNARLPAIHIVDMTQEKQGGFLSSRLLDEIQKRLTKQEQVILLQNRRGYHTVIQCRDCRRSVECPSCSVPMTYHKPSDEMRCHYCGFTQPRSRQCEFCHSFAMEATGTGTQRVEDHLKIELPGARIVRMDYDTTSSKNAHVKILKEFEGRDYDILLGTQMIAKGLDFANVTLVGVINADVGLGLPDFRANERLFQLLYQVAGRSGRGDKAGQVIVQSYTKDHPLIQMAAQQRLREYYNVELAARHELLYPPFSRLALVRVSGEDETLVRRTAKEIAQFLDSRSRPYQLLGPAQAAIYKIQKRFRWQIIIKSGRDNAESMTAMHRRLKELLDIRKEFSAKVSIVINIDPMSTM